MVDDIKKLQTSYKKATADSKDCTLSNYTTLVKRIKYFRHDAYQGFSALAEEIGVLKGENVEGKKIEDFAKESKTVDGLLKHIRFTQNKQLDAAAELQKLHDNAVDDGAKLKKLADEIDKDMKKLAKNVKPDPDIVKLQQQIDDDMKDLKTFVQKFKLIPKDHLDPSKAFDDEIGKALKARPTVSKFQKQAGDKIDLKALNDTKKTFNASVNKVANWLKNAEKFAKAGSKVQAKKMILEAETAFKKMQAVEEEYSKLKKKWSKNIKETKNSKKILAGIKYFEDKKAEFETKLEETRDKIDSAA